MYLIMLIVYPALQLTVAMRATWNAKQFTLQNLVISAYYTKP